MVAGVGFAPVIQHVPVHQEMYRDKCGAAGSAAVAKWWTRRMPDGRGIDPALAPGGFAECCFSDAGDPRKEYLYLKGRLGFMKIAIENGVDIAPLFCFNGAKMYAQMIAFLRVRGLIQGGFRSFSESESHIASAWFR